VFEFKGACHALQDDDSRRLGIDEQISHEQILQKGGDRIVSNPLRLVHLEHLDDAKVRVNHTRCVWVLELTLDNPTRLWFAGYTNERVGSSNGDDN
jgi:hypothetical protein